jgi:hypothetical protein
LCSNGIEAGCRPTSAAVLADASARNGNEPYRWKYHAADPAAAAVDAARAAREAKAEVGAEVDAKRAYKVSRGSN